MTSTAWKLRLVVGAGVVSLLVVVGAALFATQQAATVLGDATALRFVQSMLAVLLVVAVVLAWFAYANQADDLMLREQAEAALRASEAKFSGILEISADAIISVDDQQKVIHFNKGAERIFGWPAADIRGRHLNELIPPRYRPEHTKQVRNFGQTPEMARQMGDRREIFGLRRDGTEFPAEASISKLVLASGERVYTVSLRDISERVLREEAQRRLAAAMAALGETLEVHATERSTAHLAVPWLADGALLNMVTGSSLLRRIPSTGSGEALDRALARVAAHPLDTDSPSRVVDVLRRGRSEIIEAIDDEWLEAHTANPQEFERMRALGIRSLLLLPLVAREHVLGVLTLIRTREHTFAEPDRHIGEQIALRAAFALDNARLYERAQQATRARDHALGVVSHDLRNPLSAIGMCARALYTAVPVEATDRRELVETIINSTELTQRMIRDLLDVASIEVGRLALERREVQMVPALERAIDLFAGDATERGVTLRLEPAPGALPAIIGDTDRLVQALSNLLSNALRHTNRGGAVTVRVAATMSDVEVTVRDTGAGIPPDALPLIFERYWTERGSAPKGGTGLGLAIARGIVEAHGGRLTAESEVGKGSTFRIVLPAAGA